MVRSGIGMRLRRHLDAYVSRRHNTGGRCPTCFAERALLLQRLLFLLELLDLGVAFLHLDVYRLAWLVLDAETVSKGRDTVA